MQFTTILCTAMVPSDATMFAGSQPPQLDSDLLEDKDHIHYWVWRPTFPNTVGYTHRHCLVYICGLIQMRRGNCLHVFSYSLSLAYLHLWYLHSVPCFFIFCVFFWGGLEISNKGWYQTCPVACWSTLSRTHSSSVYVHGCKIEWIRYMQQLDS